MMSRFVQCVAVVVALGFCDQSARADDIAWTDGYPKYDEVVAGFPNTTGLVGQAKGSTTGQNKMKFEYRKKGDVTWIKSDAISREDGEYRWGVTNPAAGT